jgi:hypothetical protein
VCSFAGVILLAAAAPARGADDAASLDPQRVVWRELRFVARKLGISASIEVRLSRGAPAAPVVAGGHPQSGPDAPGRADDIWIESTTHLPGRTFLAREVLDPASAAARQIVDIEIGAKNHRKTYVLGDTGFSFDLVKPASLVELLLSSEQWTYEARSVFPYPPRLAPGSPVTGPAGLLYVVSAGRLGKPGQSTEIPVIVQTQIERVTVRAERRAPFALDYQVVRNGTIADVHHADTALVLVARSEPLDPASASVFRIFGLEGAVELYWDPARGLPVEISGQVKLLGHVEVHLASVTLR